MISTDIPPDYLSLYGDQWTVDHGWALTISLANEWRDEQGRFAEKGYMAAGSCRTR